MRDTSDMMEDALSEDTMMDCGGDGGGLEDLVDLATDVADSSPTIRDAAERLLTLLGVDDDNEELLSSSEDEGVEVDVDELEDDEEEQENTRLLHQLAASLAQELKYSQQKNPARSVQRGPLDTRQHQSMDLVQDTSYHDHIQNQIDPKGHYHQSGFPAGAKYFGNLCQDRQDTFRSLTKDVSSVASSALACLDRRLRTDEALEQGRSPSGQEEVLASWGTGWDACATEALRYLVEDEGLPPHHPTVLAMKNHLEFQRDRAFAQYTA